eukprot:1170987-Pyramimonas_sp.AAC.1
MNFPSFSNSSSLGRLSLSEVGSPSVAPETSIASLRGVGVGLSTGDGVWLSTGVGVGNGAAP